MLDPANRAASPRFVYGRVGNNSFRNNNLQHAPNGYLRLSDAVDRLAAGMRGGLRRPVLLQTVKQTAKRASIGFGPWREHAARCFRAAALNGEPAIYVVAGSKHRDLRRRARATIEAMVVPTSVLKRLITSREGLPDHAIRPTIKSAEEDEKLCALLVRGLLVVRESDFDGWYRSQRRKGKWASQRSKSKIGDGRPTKRTEALRNAILALVHDGAWSGKTSFTKLRRVLVTSGHSDVPSVDTLERVVRDLHRETGEPELLRIPRVRRKRT